MNSNVSDAGYTRFALEVGTYLHGKPVPQPHCTVRGANAKELTDRIYEYPARVNRSLSLRASHADRKVTDKLKQARYRWIVHSVQPSTTAIKAN
jgi:hypothetical protein